MMWRVKCHGREAIRKFDGALRCFFCKMFLYDLIAPEIKDVILCYFIVLSKMVLPKQPILILRISFNYTLTYAKFKIINSIFSVLLKEKAQKKLFSSFITESLVNRV
jgi:hypothetical protein